MDTTSPDLMSTNFTRPFWVPHTSRSESTAKQVVAARGVSSDWVVVCALCAGKMCAHVFICVRVFCSVPF